MGDGDLTLVERILRNLDRSGIPIGIDIGRLAEESGMPELDFRKRSTKALKLMPKEHISKQDEHATCTICIDSLRNAVEIPEEHQLADSSAEFKTTVLVMPCKHRYHQFCLTLWLEKEATCPTCRQALKTDREYEEEERKANIEELHNSMFS